MKNVGFLPAIAILTGMAYGMVCLLTVTVPVSASATNGCCNATTPCGSGYNCAPEIYGLGPCSDHLTGYCVKVGGE
jgi:hypothetical protein